MLSSICYQELRLFGRPIQILVNYWFGSAVLKFLFLELLWLVGYCLEFLQVFHNFLVLNWKLILFLFIWNRIFLQKCWSTLLHWYFLLWLIESTKAQHFCWFYLLSLIRSFFHLIVCLRFLCLKLCSTFQQFNIFKTCA